MQPSDEDWASLRRVLLDEFDDGTPEGRRRAVDVYLTIRHHLTAAEEDHMNKLWGREPAVIIGALNALLAVAVGFGLDITPAQVGLLNAAMAAVLAIVVRQAVTSPVTAQRLRRKAVKKAT